MKLFQLFIRGVAIMMGLGLVVAGGICSIVDVGMIIHDGSFDSIGTVVLPFAVITLIAGWGLLAYHYRNMNAQAQHEEDAANISDS